MAVQAAVATLSRDSGCGNMWLLERERAVPNLATSIAVQAAVVTLSGDSSGGNVWLLPKPDLFLYPHVLNGCCLVASTQITFGHHQSLHLYCRLLRSSGSPTAFPFPFVLKSCAALSLPTAGSQFHALSVKAGCEPDPFVQTALITICCGYGSVENAHVRCSTKVPSRKRLLLITALIAGYAGIECVG
ncbi:hypothetical protein Acr_25g0004890 [Actinidia rufa]|uniref:Uncharacterized protein n=1 Tax=Actinidia rufa TaxID=165716 RepID=A0A7J0GZ17_9ERIC|nr:hypothetical protein Acr_25g0004890 [Actinidia rufa]